MNTHRYLIASAALFAVLASPVLAQGTPPPNGRPQGSNTVSVCHYDSNDGLIHLEVVQPDQAPVDRGTATEGHDTLAENNVCPQTQQNTPVPATPVPPIPETVVHTPTATGVPDNATTTPTPIPTVAVEQSTATPTAVPTATVETPTDTPTPLPLVPEPTPPAWVPACTPEQPQGTVCGGKG